MKLSNFILLGLVPLIIGLTVSVFLFADFGPLQSLAHKAAAAVLALSIINAYLRLNDFLIGIQFTDDIHNIEKHQRVVYYRTRLYAYCGVVAIIFAFA